MGRHRAGGERACGSGVFESEPEAKRNVARAIETVAKRLGNTPAICRKCYVHPAVVEAYFEKTLPQGPSEPRRTGRRPHRVSGPRRRRFSCSCGLASARGPALTRGVARERRRTPGGGVQGLTESAAPGRRGRPSAKR